MACRLPPPVTMFGLGLSDIEGHCLRFMGQKVSESKINPELHGLPGG